MKNILPEIVKVTTSLFFTFCFLLSASFAQAPQKMSYQAVIRDGSTNLVTSHAVGMRISILQSGPNGTTVYVETQNATTNANGLVSIEIGGGTPVTGTFATIDWSAGPYSIKTETDPTGGINYESIVGTSELLSVPYALYAKTVASYTETDPTVKAIQGIVKSNGTTISAATAGTDYLTPTGSAATLTGFPILNQNTTGSAASFTGSLTGDVTGTQGATVVGNSAVIGKVLTGYVSGAGTVTATDNILQAIQKLNGNTTHSIGESYGGGIVFYIYDNGQHGLIAATTDQSTGIRWYAGTFTYTLVYADGVGAGKANTAILIANQGYGDGGTYAVRICNEYSVTMGGVTYGDWYLPSKFELNLLYLQKAMVGGFSSGKYWSSTDGIGNGQAWAQFFSVGTQFWEPKNVPDYVRAIRAF